MEDYSCEEHIEDNHMDDYILVRTTLKNCDHEKTTWKTVFCEDHMEDCIH